MHAPLFQGFDGVVLFYNLEIEDIRIEINFILDKIRKQYQNALPTTSQIQYYEKNYTIIEN